MAEVKQIGLRLSLSPDREEGGSRGFPLALQPASLSVCLSLSIPPPADDNQLQSDICKVVSGLQKVTILCVVFEALIDSQGNSNCPQGLGWLV